MSATLRLSGSYASFFWKCTKFAVSPYTNTFMSIVNDEKEDPIINRIIAATAVTGILTFVVPVLPVLSAFTFALASIGMLLAVGTMFATYPVAVLADACTGDIEFDNHFHGHSFA